MQHGMMMCAECRDKEAAVVPASSTIAASTIAVIESKADIFNADTVSIIELSGRVYADASVPDSQKEYEITRICNETWQHFQKVAFEARKAVLEAEKSAKEWQTNMQARISKLTPELRDKFKSVDATYQPVVKTVKPKAVKANGQSNAGKGTSAAERQALKDACAKYGTDSVGTRMMMVQRNLSANDAAKLLAEMMAK
jgi:hypothetical protein